VDFQFMSSIHIECDGDTQAVNEKKLSISHLFILLCTQRTYSYICRVLHLSNLNRLSAHDVIQSGNLIQLLGRSDLIARTIHGSVRERLQRAHGSQRSSTDSSELSTKRFDTATRRYTDDVCSIAVKQVRPHNATPVSAHHRQTSIRRASKETDDKDARCAPSSRRYARRSDRIDVVAKEVDCGHRRVHF
jgi:hypothetical protein